MFRLDDRSIQYPFTRFERVSSKENTLLAGAAPLVLLVLWAVTARPGVHKAHVTILGLFFSVYLTVLITDIIKKAIGRPRPDLIARCQPKRGTPTDIFVTVAVCTQPDLHFLLDGWQSFPSAHSSWAFSGLGYLSLFLAGQLHIFRPRPTLTSILLFLAPLMCAALVAMSRIADYRHDVYDVSCGSLIGFVVAYTTYRRDYRPLTHPGCDTPYPRLSEYSLIWETASQSGALEPGLESEDTQDIELFEASHINNDHARGCDDMELGHFSDNIPKDDALRTPDGPSRRPLKLMSSKDSSAPRRFSRKNIWIGRHVVSRFRRLLIRGAKDFSPLKVILMLLGVLQALSSLNNLLEAVFPDGLDLISGPFKPPLRLEDGSLERLTAGVQPIMCHSHNDYFRAEPLYQAIRAGCTSVEADLWHVDGELYVAHTMPAIRQDRTLKSLYLEQLQDILDHQNRVPPFIGSASAEIHGVFAAHPEQSLILLMDFKNDPTLMWHRLSADIAPLRERNYLTFFNGTTVVPGPVTLVVSGNAPFDHVVANSTYRDIFYDAPLGLMSPLSLPETPSPPSTNVDEHRRNISSPLGNPDMYSSANSYFASVSFVRSIGYPWHSSLSKLQLERLRQQIHGAHARGLKVRYWGIPAWPVGVRNYIWRVLVREGVDYLSADNIDAVTKENWGPRKGGWGKKWWQ
ncbi:Altered inheritance of mitochondria protein 6 [Exophiala oligosperma]